MIYLSKFPFKTQKSVQKVSDNKSTSILLQAWFIRQTMAWVYTYTTLWLKVLEKIKNIVREEMDNYSCFETFMPSLSPRELWETTWRWDSIDVMFHVPAANNKEYWLNSTHEEIVTPLLWEFIKSYKDLPVCVYQIQNKFRNEKRAKSWLLRGREFIMKDAYSFHADNEEFEIFYEWMKQVYLNVFNRLGLWKDIYIVKADWWTFTDKYSHEFQIKLEIWEDIVFFDKSIWEAFNKEVTPSLVWIENISEKELFERQDIEAIWIIWVEELSKTLWVSTEKCVKTMMYEVDWRFIVVWVRWDYEINTLKLQKLLWAKSIKMASQELIFQKTWAEIGYSWIYNLAKEIEIYLDDSLLWLTNFETWTNKTGFHSINVNFWRDIDVPEKFYDFKEAKIWDKNPETGEVYEVFKASEVGNIFPLETKFSKAFSVSFLDNNNVSKTPIMWCYGIWVSRLMWVLAEYFLDETWILWPEVISPITYYIIVIWEDNLDKWNEISKSLNTNSSDIIIDDRFAVWFWQKMSDAEIIWSPNIIIVSPKTIEKWWYELKKRWTKDSEFISFSF